MTGSRPLRLRGFSLVDLLFATAAVATTLAVLAPVVARNVSVVRTQLSPAKEDVSHERLSALRFGERCRVIDISRACQGPQRRRLLDYVKSKNEARYQDIIGRLDIRR